MKPYIFLLLFILVIPIFGCSQADQNDKIEAKQKEIMKAIAELNGMTSVNYMKHVNQVEGFKDGIWIESTNGFLWFINYKMGLKEGQMNVYYLQGQKYLEATYSKGVLIGKMIFYDTKGGLLEVNENIKLSDTIVIRNIERAEGGSIYFTKEPHKFMYSAEVKKYTETGEVYAIGRSLFDDNWGFESYRVGEWIDPRDEE